jgi:signal transduction histidine kinase/CheY-like chemotaxis protein
MAHELQQETRRREAVEQQDAALTQANATLANELSVVSQNYASAQEQLIQLQRKLEESLGTLTQTAAQLQQESQLRQAAEQRALTSAEANRDLGRQLIERLQVEADLRSLKDEAERQLQETSASLNWTTLELNKTVADRQEAQRQVETLDNTNTELSQQLLELARTDTGLRKAKGELERQLQQATETLAKATEALTKECAERERLEEAFQAARQEWCREREANRLEIASSGHALEIEVAGRQRIEADLARARYLALEEMRVKAESLDNLHGKVRAPLNSIFAVANRFLEVEITDPQRAGVESLLAGARDLADTLDELGRCLETKVGFETFVEQDLDPRDLAERLVDDLRGEAETKETDAASIVHQDVPAVLRGDPRRLREVLRHLLKHAIQVTDHGEVVLQVRRQREMNAVVLLRFEVRDTGNGLSAERRHGLASLVIEPDRVAARPLGSNEIPLAIAKLLVGMMGGEFGIDTTPAQGSVRWFTVPLAKPPTGMGSDSGARRCLNDWRVVVAGENQRRCRILSAQLTAAGARTALATSGVDAIASLRREALAGRRYDVAIINQELPDMNGLTLARLIKSDPAIAPTRLVMMSDPGAPVATDQLDIAGFEGRLRKPVRQSEVEACLASLLSGPGLPG